MTINLRFAPSPTGDLHLGNLRTALINWLLAKKLNGNFMLRIDDTDTARSEERFVHSIINDLGWLGIVHDKLVRQSERLDRYQAKIEQLKNIGKLYPCFETKEELERKKKLPIASGRPPIYDRQSLNLSTKEKEKYSREGRKPYWRLLLEEKTVSWKDLIKGEIDIDLKNTSDPVLVRQDGTPLFTLTSVVDDIELQISHVVRGDDHISNTAAQILLTEYLGGSNVSYAHHSLLTTKSGEAFSKREKSLGLDSCRKQGIEAMTINSFLAKISTSDAISCFYNMEGLIKDFDISKISESPAKFNIIDLQRLNVKLIQGLDYHDAKNRFDEMNIKVTKELWLAIKNNIISLAEAEIWLSIISKHVVPIIKDKKITELASSLLPDEPWNENTWDTWISKIKEKTSVRGKDLMFPIRLAITGREGGPEMKKLLPLLKKELVKKRLDGITA